MAQSEDYSPSQGFTKKQVSADYFFEGLKKKVAQRAKEASADRAYKMQQILAFRKNLGSGWGRFPKWEAGVKRVNGVWKKEYPEKSNRSFAGWRVMAEGNGVWSLRNDVGARGTGSWQGYSYVRNLTNGTGWSARVRSAVNMGTSRRLVRGPFGTIFSYQMPQGLGPWLKHQKELLKSDIKQIVKESKKGKR